MIIHKWHLTNLQENYGDYPTIIRLLFIPMKRKGGNQRKNIP